jgi:hypothetical protein
MNVLDKRKSVFRKLKGELENSYLVINAPDHPLLLRGPDLIVGSEAGLLAVFLPHAAEIRDVSLLETRLTLSRLALPGNTCTVLSTSEDEDWLANEFGQHFSEIIRMRDFNELPGIARHASAVGKTSQMPRELIQEAQERFLDVYQVTQAVRWISQRKDRGREIASEQSKRMKAAKRTEEGNLGETLFVRFGEGTLTNQTMYPLVRKRVANKYVLEGGIPHPTTDVPYGLVSVKELPHQRIDPDKLLRASAFAGWAIVDEANDLPRISNNLATRRIRRRRG